MTTTIVFCVGEGAEKKEFTVLQSLATKSSKLIQTTLNGEWKESGDKRVLLPETKVSEYEAYMEWLYAIGKTLVRLYLLGDFLGDDRFDNAVIDTLISGCQAVSPWRFAPADLDFVWERTLPGSTLRKFLVELIVRFVSSDWAAPYFHKLGSCSKYVTADIFARMSESSEVADEILWPLGDNGKIRKAMKAAVEHPKDNKDKCAYHRHNEGYPRCA